MHESILVYKNFRYLKLSSGLVAISLFVFFWPANAEQINGGGWLSYTLGSIAALLVLLLLWLGIRKRSYHSTAGNYQGWVSAHIYLGVSLLIIATLHSGFELDWNLHSLTYILLVISVVSGLYGLSSYLRYPRLITANRAGMSKAKLQDQILEQEQECLRLADQLDPKLHAKIVDTLEASAIADRDGQLIFNHAMDEITAVASKSTDRQQVNSVQNLIRFMGAWSNLMGRRREDLRHHNFMRRWLLIHVPVSIGLLAALISHVLSVFIYW